MSEKTIKVVINKCYGGFGLSEAAYEWMIEHGVPVRKYNPEKPGQNGLYERVPENEGEIIFDRTLEPPGSLRDSMMRISGRYWDCWMRNDRKHPLIVGVVEALGDKASGPFAKLKVVEIPADSEWEIDEYDGLETVREVGRTWG